MGLIINDIEITDVNVDDLPIDTIIVNDVTIWERISEFVLTVTTNEQQDYTTKGLEFNIVSGDTGCTITFDGETQTVEPNSDVWINFERDAGITGNLSVKGSFSKLQFSWAGDSQKGYAKLGVIKNIVKWYTDKDYVPNYLFWHQNIDFDITLPTNITKIEDLTFADCYWSSDKMLIIPNPSQITSIGFIGKPYGSDSLLPVNFTLKNDYFYYINDILVNHRTPTTATSITIPNNTRVLADRLLCPMGNLSLTLVYSSLTTIILPTDGVLQNISNRFAYGCTALTTCNIPASVNRIGEGAFNGCSKLLDITFNQPVGMNVQLPTAGTSTGMFYYKSARAMTIRTDNQSIHDYDWVADNVTPTFYHLDGSAWE